MKELMIGNFAIARGFVEAGIDFAAAYPGTPSSEILPGIIEVSSKLNMKVHCEWSVNERVALEAAFGASIYGKKACCMMKQVGLNVAFPSFFHGLERKIEGSLVIVSCDDPGPLSSQTEQDTRMVSSLLNVTTIDPSSPSEAADSAYYATILSQRLKSPVLLRPTHRVSHSRELVRLFEPGKRKPLLKEGVVNRVKDGRLGILASGVPFSTSYDILKELGLLTKIPIFKVLFVHPLTKKAYEFRDSVEKLLVLEETDSVLEKRLFKDGKVLGRLTGTLPKAGELSYDIIRDAIVEASKEAGLKSRYKGRPSFSKALEGIRIIPRPPKLCSGCPHRGSFYSMKRAFPKAIFTGDIGCYTLGIPLGAVDIFIDMGGSVTLASGLHDVFKKDLKEVRILSSCGDSTFFHACIPALYDAHRKDKKFILVIMDNGVVAMTGMQPTPQSGINAKGEKTRIIRIEDVLKGLGFEKYWVVDPYEVKKFIETLKQAMDSLEKIRGPAVIIARRECLLYRRQKFDKEIDLEDICTGCKRCVKTFDCPAMGFDDSIQRVRINWDLCVRCGVCLYVCPESEKRRELKRWDSQST